MLTRYRPRPKVRKEKNLLSGDEDDVEEEVRELSIVSSRLFYFISLIAPTRRHRLTLAPGGFYMILMFSEP